MKKTISYKVAQPPFGINGGLALRNSVNGQVLDNKAYIPYGDPFTEATCLYLGREGAIIALAIPKDKGIRYALFAASALISQSFQLNPTFGKVINISGNPSLGKYVDQLMEPYDPLNGSEVSHSIYTKAAAEINSNFSKSMASDETEIIDFSYQIEYYPAVLDEYATLAGNWFKTKNKEYFDPFINNDAGGMVNLYIAEGLGTASRSGQDQNKMQTPDGSFISFWPFDTGDLTENLYSYDQVGLQELLNDGLQLLTAVRDEQLQVWEEEYSTQK